MLAHLTSAGTDWAGSVSITIISVLHSLSILPTRWFLTAELAPVYHMVWAVPLAAAAHWGPSLVSVMLFPLAVQVSYLHPQHISSLLSSNLGCLISC